MAVGSLQVLVICLEVKLKLYIMSEKVKSIVSSILGWGMWVYGIVALSTPKLNLTVAAFITIFFMGAVAIWFKGDKMIQFLQKNIGSILSKK